MSNEIEKFDFNGNPLRVVMRDGEPWFVLTDIAKTLGYRDAEKAKRVLRDSQFNTLSRGIASELGFSGGRSPLVVSESGLYRLIMRSNVEGALVFQDWVTSEVLPAIRRTGKFEMTADNTPEEVQELTAQLSALEATNAVLAYVAVKHVQLVEASGGWYLGDAARMLGVSPRRFTPMAVEVGALQLDPKGRPRPSVLWVANGWMTTRNAGQTAVVTDKGLEVLSNLLNLPIIKPEIPTP